MSRRSCLSGPGCWYLSTLANTQISYTLVAFKLKWTVSYTLSCFCSSTKPFYCMFYLSTKSSRFFFLWNHTISLSVLIESSVFELTSSEKCLGGLSAVNKHRTVPLATCVKIGSSFDTFVCADKIKLQLCWQFFWLWRYILRELWQTALLFVLTAKEEFKQLIISFLNEQSFLLHSDKRLNQT